ncbi:MULTISPECIES: IS3 family transposase [unclassified Streptomyces]|uniref:IS3 family transposase n=1 Tax=unclassified Streptomyces TaxID=2593676 RepID=UPI002257A63E|nr:MULTISPECIES: IS3 family transposase [unclassified Streptomyces]MCX4404435.1 IS3 family transposase [Streptomyces sp. NBC_01764]MCX5181263.1 IS3 family transposase [Streptomyces sp. NBC_00268]MCX5181377.1 IS3 family transposase [Streptomyces sp. NBC_00268]MCX5188963.1 IS3 family transposase [Streptomyces sp. NBC_00268]MCX5190626.1 IS3 family transposase [Streptomyces sp. NBC_00268]
MARPSQYPLELRRRAVRMVAEVRPEYDTEWAAMKAVAQKLGIGTTETLRKWVRQDQVDAGVRPGVTTEESSELKRLKKENAELKRANEILKAAAKFLRGRARPATRALVAFIDEHRDRFGGVEPICRALSAYDCKIAPSTYYAHHKRRTTPSARTVRDAELKEQISKVFESNYHVYGARKIWRELNRQGRRVARCTVERLMRELGIAGAVRGKRVITTLPGGQVERAPDLLDRDFVAGAPNRCWVADFTYVKTWAGVVYVAFVVDTFSRRIVGWSAATVKETVFVLDALEMALWQRDRDQHPVQPGELIHHSDAGSQYTSFRLAEHLDAAGIAASIGSVGDAYDNALMESTIGLFKTELIKPRRPWKTLSDVELATAEYIDWYNHRRLHGEIGHLPPVEYENNHYLATTKPQVTTNI